jgi:hypothetical protein
VAAGPPGPRHMRPGPRLGLAVPASARNEGIQCLHRRADPAPDSDYDARRARLPVGRRKRSAPTCRAGPALH